MSRPRPHPDLRLSDADRDRAVARLSEHFAAGRLDKDEFDERSDAIWTSKTYADLAPVFADLGRAPSERERGGDRHRGPWGRRWWLPVPFVPVLLVLVALTVLTHVPFVLLLFLGCAFVIGRGRRRSHWRHGWSRGA
jgi:hypothetical protein